MMDRPLPSELETLDISGAAEAISAGSLRPSDLVETSLAAIAAREPIVQAWEHVDADGARALARAQDGGPVTAPLHGIPVGIKDVIDTADMPTAYGSKAYVGFRPAADASCVSILRAAGAVIFGKTVSTEFASVAPNRTTNPHNAEHTPGGSSSGSAAAVAAGMVKAALGTQTAGSVIRPAAYCGVVGYKPSFGLIDRTGVKTLAQSFDTVGTFTTSVRDAALLTSVLAGRNDLRRLDPDHAPRIGIYQPPWAVHALPAQQSALAHVKAVLSRHGFDVAEVRHIEGFDGLLAAQQDVMDWDMVHALHYELHVLAGKIDPITRDALKGRRERMSARACDAAQAHLVKTRAALHAAMERLDILLVPPTHGEASKGLSSTGSSDFNRGWTALGVPCLTIPVGSGPAGLPLGVQLIGKLHDDAAVLNVGSRVEAILRTAPPGILS
jgi:Asp-tRNA(Asn)/Glu-tRNA(Gln) amidotransferase A subunit family amidase